MKKLFGTLLIMCSVFLFSCSSDDGPEDDVIWDFVPYTVNFAPTNIAGGNLTEHDIDITKNVTVEYKGKTYELIAEESQDKTKAVALRPLALRKEHVYERGTYFTFGEFAPGSYKGEEFAIHWGNGRTDKVKFDLYITWKKHQPTIHKTVSVNDRKVSDSELTVSILIE